MNPFDNDFFFCLTFSLFVIQWEIPTYKEVIIHMITIFFHNGGGYVPSVTSGNGLFSAF